jgi:hypothetical protein
MTVVPFTLRHPEPFPGKPPLAVRHSDRSGAESKNRRRTRHARKKKKERKEDKQMNEPT